jgi:hypothetical protein
MKSDYFLPQIRGFAGEFSRVSKEHPLHLVLFRSVKYGLAWIDDLLHLYYYKIFKSRQPFTFNERVYRYFYHIYNDTWRSERAVEIPVVWEIVQQNRHKRILEVGNVLSHYFAVDHDILDKYEQCKGVMNHDVVAFHPPHKYDLIVSISTLEHVGAGESYAETGLARLFPSSSVGVSEEKEPRKVLRAIENLHACLDRGGRLMVTLPIGQNPDLDRFLANGEVRFSELYFLKRVSKDNRWVQVRDNSIFDVKYNEPYPAANAVAVGIISASEA